MNLRTGEIIEDFNAVKEGLNHLVELSKQDLDDMTDKQKAEGKVSLKDTRSKLGKKLHEERRRLGYDKLTRNQRRNLRKKLRK